MDKSLLKELIAVDAVRVVQLTGVPGGFVVNVSTDTGTRTLCAQRGHARVFKQLNSAAEFLQSLGVSRFNVDASAWEKET